MKLPLRALPLLLGVSAVMGCDLLQTPYTKATLEEAVKQQVPSADLRYEIERPNIPVVRRNTGIVREGTLFMIIVGPDLKRVLATYGGDDVRYGVRLVRQPRAHLVLEAVFVGEEKIDLLADAKKFRFHFPELVTDHDIPFASFQVLARGTVAGIPESKAQLTELTVSREPVPEGLKAAIGELEEGGRPDRPRYFLEGDGGRLLVTGSDPMTLLMLDFLLEEGKAFSGGVRVKAVWGDSVRRSTDAVGAVEVRWIHLGGPTYYRAR